jgi:hypothetical protein
MWRDHSGASDVLEKVRSKLNAKISRMRLTSMRCITTTAFDCAASLSHCSGGLHSKSLTLSLQLTSPLLPVPSLTPQIHHNGAPLHHRLRPQEVRRILRKRHQRRPMGTIVLSPSHPIAPPHHAYTFVVSNGDTRAPSPASTASRAPSPASASRRSRSAYTSPLSRLDC